MVLNHGQKLLAETPIDWKQWNNCKSQLRYVAIAKPIQYKQVVCIIVASIEYDIYNIA
jgi:hypothetical protein